MNKKDMKLIVILLVIAAVIFVGYKFYNSSQSKTYGIVKYRDSLIHTFDVNHDEEFVFEGSYGSMKLEVKDGKWRITEEECPNHICSSIGWVSADEYFPIVCIPNEVIVTLRDN